MKRIVVAMTLLLLIACFPLHAEKEAIARIIEAKGDVTVIVSGASKATKPTPGQALASGDVVRTGSNGHAILLFSDGNRMDLFARSNLKIKEKQKGKKDAFLGPIWKMVNDKMSDAEYTKASAGQAGAVRGKKEEEGSQDQTLSNEEQKGLHKEMEKIGKANLSSQTKTLARAVIYEKYAQYHQAEELYLSLIKDYPHGAMFYDMLIDLYIKIDMNDHAQKVLEQKKAKGL